MKKLLIILFILFSTSAHADLITMPQYGPFDTLTNTNLNQRWNLLTNELNGNLNNLNADADGGFRFIEILAALPAPGIQGRVVFLTADNTLQFDTGTSYLATALLANSQTFSGTNTFTGPVNISGALTVTGNSTFAGTTIADLGMVTTADINGGTMDNVGVDSATATGMLYVNDASDDLSQLGSQGTSGQFLQSAGSGANPVFASSFGSLDTATSISSSNSGNIPISASKIYRVIISITSISADSTIWLRVDSDSGAADYSWLRHGLTNPGTPATVDSGDNSAAQIVLGSVDFDNANNRHMSADLTFDTAYSGTGSSRVRVTGNIFSFTEAGQMELTQIAAHYTDATDINDFEILSDGGETITGNVYVYDYTLTP